MAFCDRMTVNDFLPTLTFQFQLPKGVDVDKLSSEVKLNGMLVISAPSLPGTKHSFFYR
jgi:hypothetical protein